MSYSITNLDSNHSLNFGGVTIRPQATEIVTEDRLASMGPGGIAYFNTKVVAGLASVTYLGYTAPLPDTYPANQVTNPPPVTTYTAAANPIPLSVRYASPLGQALMLASTQAAMQSIIGSGAAAGNATTSTAGLVKQAAATTITTTAFGTPAATLVDVGTSFNQANINNNFASINAALASLYAHLQAAGISL
jgi:hypothetical protein